jgi:hypothetical protein
MEEKIENMSSRKLRDYMASSLGFTEAVTCRFSETAEGSRVELISEPALQAERRNGDQWVWEECAAFTFSRLPHESLDDVFDLLTEMFSRSDRCSRFGRELTRYSSSTGLLQPDSKNGMKQSARCFKRFPVNMKIFWISADVKTKPALG